MLRRRLEPRTDDTGRDPSSLSPCAGTDAGSAPGDVLFNVDTIDLMVVRPDRSEVLLVIINDAGWSGSDAQIESLGRKVDNYVSFALDGQMVTTDPSLEGLPWAIGIVCHEGRPDGRTASVLEELCGAVRGYGGDLRIATSASALMQRRRPADSATAGSVRHFATRSR